MNLPVDTPEFWNQRIMDTVARGRDLHTVIYDIDPDTWKHIQGTTAGILQRHVPFNSRFLDAGCGYGAAFECLSQFASLRTVDYTGIDLSPDLIKVGKLRYPDCNLQVGDLRNLSQYKDNYFDFVLVRSIALMLKDNDRNQVWSEALKELRRVSRAIIMIEYENLDQYSILYKHHLLLFGGQ